MLDIDVDYSYHDSAKSLVHSDDVKCVHMAVPRANHFRDRMFRRIDSNLILMNVQFVLLILYDFDNFLRRRAIYKFVQVVTAPF